ncbi:hypothetical protein CYMTET_42616 [Cymbomonas tetramitiformis]|uniref:shikimate kinase n=1 Tax=Cymbomonas tetramitiformis TaxID=36881 RepID=A0AAE0C3V0_9CHLO|nr:hypothetical protein CYMTET_42616 [Cymbomonas tetramitiformis]
MTTIIANAGCQAPSCKVYVSGNLKAQRKTQAGRTAEKRLITAEVTSFSDLSADVVDRLEGSSIILVGMMGCGKSAVATAVGEAMQYAPLDSDTVIEQATGKKIPEIFAEDGEDAFRDVESQVLEELCSYKKCIIATGGGAVMKKTNWGHLRNGVVVWLDFPVEVLAARVNADGTEGRPVLEGDSGTAQQLTNLLEERRVMYEQADITVSFKDGDSDVAEVARVVLDALQERLEGDEQKQKLSTPKEDEDDGLDGLDLPTKSS